MAKSPFSCDCSVIHHEVVDRVSSEMLEEEKFQRVSSYFKLLGDPTRIKIIWALYQHEMCVCDISCVLGMTKSAVSHQLSTLRPGGLVTCRRDGKTVYYSLQDEHVRHMLESGLSHVHKIEPVLE